MIGNIICFLLGAMCGVFSLALLVISRGIPTNNTQNKHTL